MASVGTGFALYYTGGSPVSGMPPFFTREIGTGRWLGIPVPVYAAIIATILVLFLVSSTSWGRYLYAIGGNPKAAFLSGIPVGRWGSDDVQHVAGGDRGPGPDAVVEG